MPRPPLSQQPPPQFPMYQTYQTPLSWDTPTWPPPELLVDISLDQNTDMTTASPASPSPEIYTPLDHVQPDPPASVPIVTADPPVPVPTITPDPPAPSEAYQLLDRLFPAPPDLPKRPYNPMWKPLKPDWNRLLGPSMIWLQSYLQVVPQALIPTSRSRVVRRPSLLCSWAIFLFFYLCFLYFYSLGTDSFLGHDSYLVPLLVVLAWHDSY